MAQWVKDLVFFTAVAQATTVSYVPGSILGLGTSNVGMAKNKNKNSLKQQFKKEILLYFAFFISMEIEDFQVCISHVSPFCV